MAVWGAGVIAIACALGYLDLRLPEFPWRQHCTYSVLCIPSRLVRLMYHPTLPIYACPPRSCVPLLREGKPTLARWFDAFRQRPSMQETYVDPSVSTHVHTAKGTHRIHTFWWEKCCCVLRGVVCRWIPSRSADLAPLPNEQHVAKSLAVG